MYFLNTVNASRDRMASRHPIAILGYTNQINI